MGAIELESLTDPSEMKTPSRQARISAAELLLRILGDADAPIERVDGFTRLKRQERARINSARRSLWLEGRVAQLVLPAVCASKIGSQTCSWGRSAGGR